MSIKVSVAVAAEQVKEAHKQAMIKGTEFRGEQILDTLAEAISMIKAGGGGGLICGDFDDVVDATEPTWFQR